MWRSLVVAELRVRGDARKALLSKQASPDTSRFYKLNPHAFPNTLKFMNLVTRLVKNLVFIFVHTALPANWQIVPPSCTTLEGLRK